MIKDILSYGIGTLAAIVRIVQASGQSVALNMLYPYPESKAEMKVA